MNQNPSTHTFWPVVGILAAVLFWGSSFAAMKVTITALGPWTVMWIRMSVALLAILPFAGKLWPLPYRPGDWKLLLPLCLFEPCLYFYFEANALRYTTSAQAGLISASLPLMAAIGASLTLGEKISRWTGLGLVVSVCGVAWLTLAGSPSEAAANPVLGNLLELAAMASAVGYILLVKRLSSRYSPWALTALQVAVGTVFFLPGAFPLISGRVAIAGAGQILTLAYLGVCVTLAAFGMFNHGISLIPANRAAAFINLIPVVAVLMGWTLLGEALNGMQMAAAVLVFAGVWMSQAKNQ